MGVFGVAAELQKYITTEVHHACLEALASCVLEMLSCWLS